MVILSKGSRAYTYLKCIIFSAVHEFVQLKFKQLLIFLFMLYFTFLFIFAQKLCVKISAVLILILSE